MYIFYKPLTDTIGRIESVVVRDDLTEEQKAKAIVVDSFPAYEEKPGYTTSFYINLVTHAITVEYVAMSGPEESIFILKDRLHKTEGKLKTAEQIYLETDIENITLDELKQLKIAELKEKCNRTIETQFVSPSTGYTFGFKAHDQNNMANQSILFLSDAGILTCDWKTEDAGVQTFTREQFLKLLPEGNDHVRLNVGKFWTLVAKVQAATNRDLVQGVHW